MAVTAVPTLSSPAPVGSTQPSPGMLPAGTPVANPTLSPRSAPGAGFAPCPICTAAGGAAAQSQQQPTGAARCPGNRVPPGPPRVAGTDGHHAVPGGPRPPLQAARAGVMEHQNVPARCPAGRQMLLHALAAPCPQGHGVSGLFYADWTENRPPVPICPFKSMNESPPNKPARGDAGPWSKNRSQKKKQQRIKSGVMAGVSGESRASSSGCSQHGRPPLLPADPQSSPQPWLWLQI